MVATYHAAPTSPRTIHIRPVLHGHDGDAALLFVDQVHQAIVPRRALCNPTNSNLRGRPTLLGFCASPLYTNSTQAVATFSGKRSTAFCAAADHRIS